MVTFSLFIIFPMFPVIFCFSCWAFCANSARQIIPATDISTAIAIMFFSSTYLLNLFSFYVLGQIFRIFFGFWSVRHLKGVFVLLWMRVESASSINLFKQCPRKYYYVYVEGKQLSKNIHLIRGSVVHSVLEKFYDFERLVERNEAFPALQAHVVELLLQEWHNSRDEFKEIGISKAEEQEYFEETVIMTLNWLNDFIGKFNNTPGDFRSAFKSLTPIREQLYLSDVHQVRGYIDAIETHGDSVSIMDYKTSRLPHITEEYRLQLSIYALLYLEKHGKLPDKLGLFFLRHGPVFLPPSMDLVEYAKKDIAFVHSKTVTDKIDDYPKTVSSNCKFCDFYGSCFSQRSLDSFHEQMNPHH